MGAWRLRTGKVVRVEPIPANADDPRMLREVELAAEYGRRTFGGVLIRW